MSPTGGPDSCVPDAEPYQAAPNPETRPPISCQVLPFHGTTFGSLSASGAEPSPVVAELQPTAVRSVASAQDTLVNMDDGELGAGVSSTVQAVPFHSALTGWMSVLPAGSAPTATQTLLVGHETLDRVPVIPTAGSCCQLLPFHDSVSGICTPEPLT